MHGPRPYLRSFAFAFFPSVFAQAVIKWISYKFPLNLVLPCHWAFLAILPSAVLLASSQARRRSLDIPLAAGSVLFALAFGQVKGLPLHFLIGDTYYPYPKPEGLQWKLAVAILAYLTVPFPLASAALHWRMRGAEHGGRAGSPLAGLLGLGAGAATTLWLIPHLGANLMVAVGASALGLYHSRPLARLATPLATAGLMALSFSFPDTFYLWAAKDYRLIESLWTRSYKVDAVAFQDDRCLGGVLNHLMVMFVCADPMKMNRDLRIIASSPALEKRRVLVLGRTDGAVPVIVRSLSPGIEKIEAVEIDPAIPALFARHGKYSGGIFEDERFETSAGDFRRYLERNHPAHPYDTVFYHGLGIHLLNLPMSLVFEETYVYTQEAFELLFERTLDEDGVLVIDWGSSKEFEAYYLVANLPEGVKSRVVWSVTNEQPMIGLPLFFAIASKDGRKVDAVVEHLRQRVSPFREVPLPPDLGPYRFTDDWPFMNAGFAKAQAFAGLPFLAALSFLVWKGRPRGGAGRAVPLLDAFSAVLAGATYALVLSRNTRLFTVGPADSEIWVMSSFWAGAAAALWSTRRQALDSRLAVLALSLACAGVYALNASASSSLQAVAYPFALSFALHRIHHCRGLFDSERAGGTLAATAAGILVAQILALALGYASFHALLAFFAVASGIARAGLVARGKGEACQAG